MCHEAADVISEPTLYKKKWGDRSSVNIGLTMKGVGCQIPASAGIYVRFRFVLPLVSGTSYLKSAQSSEGVTILL